MCTPTLRFDVGASVEPNVLTVFECDYAYDAEKTAMMDDQMSHYTYVEHPTPAQPQQDHDFT